MKLLGKVIKFGCPVKSDIVIYDEWHSDKIVKYILQGDDHFIYRKHPEEIMVCPIAMLIFFKSISLFDISMIECRKDKLRAFFSQLLFCYRVAILKVVAPKVIITMIDNAYDFHELAKKYDSAEFFAIQNALRVNYDLKKNKKFYIPHYFTFGEYTKNVMIKYNHNIVNYYPVGSFRLGIADKFFKDKQHYKYDIGIVSQYRGKQNIVSDDESILERSSSMDKMHSFLSNYISDTGRSAAMIMVTDSDCEVNYYNKYYDGKIDYLFNNREKLSSFNELTQCEVVVAFFSSLSIEALGVGRKVLRIDLTDGDNWNEYDNKILLKTKSYNDVKDRLESLLQEPYYDYNKRIESYSKYLMDYNPDLPPHEYIRNKIKEYY